MTPHTIIQKIALALKAANDEIYAHVRYNHRHDTWELWVDGKPVEVNFKSHDEAEDRCETLNYEYAARKVVEVITGNTPYIFEDYFNLVEFVKRHEKLHL